MGTPETPSAPNTALLHNPQLPRHVRYGWVLWWAATLALLIASDVGSGVQALTQTVPDERLSLNFQSDVQILLEASVFTSVSELWKAGSKPLAIFVTVTSIAWPYVKLLLTLYAWITPFRLSVRRERLLVALDVLGKWSLADVVVFVVIMVVFRERIPLGAGYLEVWIKPMWGLYGFVVASLSSLAATHVAVYFFRSVVYGEDAPGDGDVISTLRNEPHDSNVNEPHDGNVEHVDTAPKILLSTNLCASNSGTPTSTHSAALGASVQCTTTRVVVPLLWIAAAAAYLSGCILYTFEVTDVQQGLVRAVESYSVANIGRALPDAKREYESAGGLVFLQILWFLLGIAIPMGFLGFLAVLWYKPLTTVGLRRWLTMTEVAFAWSGGEVLLLSIVLAIREIPTFADGLIETGCSQCYTVETEFLAGTVVVWVVGTVATIVIGLIVLTKAHTKAYRPSVAVETETVEQRTPDEADGET